MTVKTWAARFALVVSCGLMTATPAMAQFWQCAPYAREISGIDIHGNANTWWGQAAGSYERGHAPKVGAVLAFQSDRAACGSAMSRWCRRSSATAKSCSPTPIGRAAAGSSTTSRAVDVSAAGDWSEVKVWYGPQGGLGTSTYPTNGFIYSGHARRRYGATGTVRPTPTTPARRCRWPASTTGGRSHDRRPRLSATTAITSLVPDRRGEGWRLRLARRERHRHAVHAIALAGRLRPVVEDMAQMPAAPAAMHLGPRIMPSDPSLRVATALGSGA